LGSGCRRDIYVNSTQHSQQTDIQRAATDPRFRWINDWGRHKQLTELK